MTTVAAVLVALVVGLVVGTSLAASTGPRPFTRAETCALVLAQKPLAHTDAIGRWETLVTRYC